MGETSMVHSHWWFQTAFIPRWVAETQMSSTQGLLQKLPPTEEEAPFTADAHRAGGISWFLLEKNAWFNKGQTTHTHMYIYI